MIVELLSIAAVFIGGCALVRAGGVRGWALPALGFLAGTSIQITIGVVQVVTALPTYPAITLALTVALPLTWWIIRWRRREDVAVSVPYALATAAAVGLAVVVFWFADRVKWHTDSLTYMIASDLLAHNTFSTNVSTHFMTGRTLGLPLLHAPANAANESYLRSLTPLLAAATLAVLVWFLQRGLRGRVPAGPMLLIGGLSLALLVSNNRFIFSAFYLNGHLQLAAQTVIIAGCGWLLVTRSDVPAAGLMAMQLVTVPALVVIRPEGTLVAALALLPTLLAADIARRHRVALLVTLGASTIAWQGFMAVTFARRDEAVPASVLGMLALGLMLFAAIPLLRWSFLLSRARAILWISEAGLWLAILALAVRKPVILKDSIDGTVQNVFLNKGGWGLSLVCLAVVLLAVAIMFRAPHQVFLRFPVTTFLPMGLLLAYLRDGGYRAGYGDSLNRMFMHMVPLAILYIMVAATSHVRSTTPPPVPAPRRDDVESAPATQL